MKEEVITWLREGCSAVKGVALYLQYGDNLRFKALLRVNPEPQQAKLKLLLCRMAGVSDTYSEAVQSIETDKFRKMYPFLSDPSVPVEIKALATDKMTTYWKVVELHEKLFACHTNIDCLTIARALVNCFVEDQTIKKELDYYKRYGGVLGQHRIFSTHQRQEELRKMNLRDLLKKEKQLRDNVWRIKSEIAKGDKPHLLPEREKRLREKENELNLVNNLLNE